MYKITIISKCVSNIVCDAIQLDEETTDFMSYLPDMHIDDIVSNCNDFIDDKEDLTEYSDIPGIESETVHFESNNDNKTINVVANVLVNQNPYEDNILQEILDELEGQYSDGWGEGFEQKEIYSWQSEQEIYDDYEQDYCDEEVDFYLYISPWGTKNMTPENCKITVEEIPD